MGVIKTLMTKLAGELPRTIYVVREQDEESSWLNTNETTDDIDDNETVGVYELREVKTKRITHTLE